MKVINAAPLDHRALNEALRCSEHDCIINGCCGQRFIAAGMSDKSITINGIPGNALGAYLNNASICVNGNAQDAAGDTMNDGKILIRGNAGDAAGYAMRGGKLYIRGNAGYRTGIHMKAYQDKVPIMIIGGCAGSFLGEYQAGGIIIVLNLENSCSPAAGSFPCTGMHGGMVLIRGDCSRIHFPPQVTSGPASAEDLKKLSGCLTEYCSDFDLDAAEVLSSPFTAVMPDSTNPYRQMYVAN